VHAQAGIIDSLLTGGISDSGNDEGGDLWLRDTRRVKNPHPEDVALLGTPSRGAWSNGVVEYWSEIEEVFEGLFSIL